METPARSALRRILRSLALYAILVFAVSAASLLPGRTDTNHDANLIMYDDTAAGSHFLVLSTPNGADQVTVSGIGDVLLFDGATPGQVILALNLRATEAVVLTFRLTGDIDALGNVFVPAVGVAGGAITDAGLAALIGASTFEFAPIGRTAQIFTYDFTSAALSASSVPEPAVGCTVGLGLLGLSALRLRQRAHIFRSSVPPRLRELRCVVRTNEGLTR